MMVITSQFLLYWFVLKQSFSPILKFANPGQTYKGRLQHREYSYVNNNNNNNTKFFAVCGLVYSFTLRMEAVTSPETSVNCCIFGRCYIPEDGKFQPSHYLSGTICDVNCIQKLLSLSPTVLSASLLFWTVTHHVIQRGQRYPTSA